MEVFLTKKVICFKYGGGNGVSGRLMVQRLTGGSSEMKMSQCDFQPSHLTGNDCKKEHSHTSCKS